LIKFTFLRCGHINTLANQASFFWSTDQHI